MSISGTQFQVIASVIGLLVFPLLGFLWREMRRLRENDLAHLRDDFAAIQTTVRDATMNSNARFDALSGRIDALMLSLVPKRDG